MGRLESLNMSSPTPLVAHPQSAARKLPILSSVRIVLDLTSAILSCGKP